ncbi:CPCC family cysteine-rich protein [Clostridioides sp. GD02377]|uniref:CPCC family cysteine-rich protein n=1 Tax=unclassified Clostridioides TaxID=2635829 RepID=UPI0038B1A773
MNCPVCGKDVDMFDICDNCNWQNSGPKEANYKGPNKMSLKEAKEAYERGKKVI